MFLPSMQQHINYGLLCDVALQVGKVTGLCVRWAVALKRFRNIMECGLKG